MSFYIYDIIFLVLFSLGVGLFLWNRRKNLKREGILYLYRTQVGVRIISYVGNKYKKTLKFFGFISVVCGYFLMAGMFWLLYIILKVYLSQPEAVRAIKIPPLMPLIPYLPEAFNISFLPPFYFTYWIIAIAIIAVFHEFSHGIYMKLYGVKIKSTGFGFLGPFLAAFVEQDEKDMEKKPKYEQIVILTAGVFANLILAVIFLLLLSGFFVLAYVPSGYLFTEYATVIVKTDSINNIGGKQVINSLSQGLLDLIEANNLTDDLVLGDNGGGIELTKITTEGKNYYLTVEELKKQLEKGSGVLELYGDYPAINVGLKGVIIKINNREIKDKDDMSKVLMDFAPGESVKILTSYKNEKGRKILEYDVVLGARPDDKTKVFLGVGYKPKNRLLSHITDLFNFSKKEATYYEPRFNADFILFIYNLIWWLALINLSVALVNMWPVGIFDGGRMFMLTMWGITGSEKFGIWMFKLMTYLILGSLFLLMYGWVTAMI